MKSLFKYLKNYKKETALAPLFKMLEAIFDLMVPLVVTAIIDKGIRHHDGAYVLKMGGVLVLLAIVGLSLALIAQYFAAKAAMGFGKELRTALFKHIQKFSHSQLDNQGTSSLITRMTSDINQVQSQVNMVIRLLLRSPFIVFGAMIMAFYVNARIATVFVIAIPVLSVIVYGIMLITIPMYKKVQRRLDVIMKSTRENLTGVRVIRAFNKQEEEVNKYQDDNKALYRIQMITGRISTLMNPATYVIVNLAIVGILWYGGKQVDTGSVTQGSIVALVNYMSQILIELIKLANLIINVVKALACAKRIEEVFNTPAGMAEGNETGNKNCQIAVQFVNTSISYNESGENSISNLNLTVNRGETIGIIGGTGSGKSTLVNMIPRFYDCTEGEVLVDGINVVDYKLSALREKIGVVPQKAMLFAGTIRSNMEMSKKDISDEDIIDALKISQSYDFVMDKEGKLDAVVEHSGKNFSGGQRQRLTIARALVRKPEILILDDSSSALDYATDQALRKALGTLTDTTTFIVSQRTVSIMNADKIVVLDDGEVMGIGTHDELLDNCDVYKEIYESQFRTAAKEGK